MLKIFKSIRTLKYVMFLSQQKLSLCTENTKPLVIEKHLGKLTVNEQTLRSLTLKLSAGGEFL